MENPWTEAAGFELSVLHTDLCLWHFYLINTKWRSIKTKSKIHCPLWMTVFEFNRIVYINKQSTVHSNSKVVKIYWTLSLLWNTAYSQSSRRFQALSLLPQPHLQAGERSWSSSPVYPEVQWENSLKTERPHPGSFDHKLQPSDCNQCRPKMQMWGH